VRLEDTDVSWPVVASKDLYRDDWVMALRRDTVRMPDGDATFSRLVMEHPGAAVVLALDDDDRVLCISQYRHPAQRRFIELPAGLCDMDGEDPLGVAKRELMEEAGYAAERWEPLLTAYSSPGVLAEKIHYFVARDLTPIGHGDFVREHEEADMTVFFAPIEDLVEAVLESRVQDSPIMLAVLAYQARRNRAR
jgi:8-oxo-dGTP pyrophosphatase MutT (NUDIX family)